MGDFKVVFTKIGIALTWNFFQEKVKERDREK